MEALRKNKVIREFMTAVSSDDENADDEADLPDEFEYIAFHMIALENSKYDTSPSVHMASVNHDTVSVFADQLCESPTSNAITDQVH